MPRLKPILIRLPLVLLVSTLVLVLGLWLAGRVLSDRWGWSQWLLWIPTPVAIVAAIAGLGIALGWRRGAAARRGVAWTIVLGVVVVHFAFVENRLLPRTTSVAGGVRLVHWTMSHSKLRQRPLHAERIVELDGDITILVDAHGVEFEESVLDWLGPDAQPRRWGRTSVLTRLPIVQMRPVIVTSEINVVLVGIDARATLGRLLAIYVVDLPSNPRTPRMHVARALRRLLAETEAPPPDVVVGDFNMTRRGAALGATFPGLRHAYDDAGAGLGATFHRRLPLYHIDHVLLNDGVRAFAYEVIDPGFGRHLVQVARIGTDR
ncbi:MAG: endonuclease/exonuclease/phosphatase family protein [Planctomycetota bacterium]|jgi:uncharacterized membrane protein